MSCQLLRAQDRLCNRETQDKVVRLVPLLMKLSAKVQLLYGRQSCIK